MKQLNNKDFDKHHEIKVSISGTKRVIIKKLKCAKCKICKREMITYQMED